MTALMTGEVLASVRDEPVAVLDLNPGPGSLAERADSMPALAPGPSGGGQDHLHHPPAPSRLAVISSEPAAASGPPDDAAGDVARIFELLSARYTLTLADPGASAVPRVLAIADQLVLVAPASQDAARAIAMTLEWLEAHGHAELARNSATVINGVSRPTMSHVEQAEAVARGRCRAIVRVPWDDQLKKPEVKRIVGGDPVAPLAWPGGRLLGLAAVQAYTALAGVPGAGRLGHAVPGAGPPGRGRALGGTMSARTTGRSRLAVRYFDDRILLTETHGWAYYRLPTVSYEFMTPQDRETLATNVTVALAAIRMADAEVHLRIAHRPYPAAEWATGLDATSDGGPGWLDYLDEMYRHVWAKDFWSKEIYLGVRLGQRGMRAQLSGGVFSQFINLYRTGEQVMGLDDEAVSGTEIARWTDQAERLGRALGSSALAARHATSDDIAWLFRHTLMGTLGDPRPSAARRHKWGAGEIESLLEGQVHNGRTLLRLEQPGGESYAAFLSFARFPDVMYFPEGEPWLHYADSLPFPVEASLRMKLIPPAKASKDVGRRLAHARDMDAHIREAGVEAPIALAEQIEAARLLEHGITKERLPFVYGHHRLMVTAPDRELCVRRTEAVTEHYRDAGIDVVNSTGDQFSLLCESLPGDKVTLNSYLQRQPLYTIAGGMPTATVDLGDRINDEAGWIGPYIGETLGRARSVVHFDPLVAAARNRPTAVAITGEPGGGKTTLALLLILQLALRGVTVAVIDPKGDAESLVRLRSEERRV